MQVLHLLCKTWNWPLHHQVRNNLPDWQRTHRRLWNTQLSEQSRQLFGRAYVNNSAEAHPPVGRCAHWAVLTRSVDSRRRSFSSGHVRGRPASQLKFRMSGPITRRNMIMILAQDGPVPAYQDRAERLVSDHQSLTC